MDKPKVLVLRPGLEAGGGVNYYFTAIQKFLPETITFIYRGARHYPYRSNFFFEFFRIVLDYFNFLIHIVFRRYDLIHINTILNYKGLFRDMVYILTARLFRKKILVFFRGWDDEIEQKIEKHFRRVFMFMLLRADAVVSLSSDSVSAIRRWGFNKRLVRETTTVDVGMINHIAESSILSRNFDTSQINILYLGRIEKDKGIYLCLDAFRLLQGSFPDIKLHLAGEGTEYDNVLKYIEDNQIRNIVLHGFVRDKAKIDLLLESHLFILTSLKEGMPNALLEAIAAGLIIIARPIAGIKDVVVQEENGYISYSKNAQDFADLMHNALLDSQKLKRISEHNFRSAKSKYYSNVVAERLVKLYKTIIAS